MKLKVCGMKLNTSEVAQLRPDYLGFIFWKKSPRFFDGEIPPLPRSIKKIGVFVDASVDEILEKIEKYDLQGVQLHGDESPEFCRELRIKLNAHRPKADAGHVESSLPRPQKGADHVKSSAPHQQKDADPVRSSPVETSDPSTRHDATPIQIIKVFSIKDNFDFSILKPYEPVCDYFLFDTKGELPGGNGYIFDWKVLENYPSTKPYFLSGGIGLEEVPSIKVFAEQSAAKYCQVLDVNSRFEIEPGLKDINRLKKFRLVQS